MQGGQTQCKWCGEQDSLEHRYWHCVQTKQVRDKVAPHAASIWRRLPPALTLRGWALKPASWGPWMQYLSNIDSKLPSPQVSLVQLTSSTGWVGVFTDGSCAAQTEHLLRFAAWSVVVAAPFHANWNFDVGGVLASNVLPGLVQTAFRAELFALAYALHQAAIQNVAIRIWTDCARESYHDFIFLHEGFDELR